MRKPVRRGLKRRRAKGAPHGAAAAQAAPFDEPADAAPPPNPSIEEPTTPGMLAGEPETACGLPDAGRTRPSDLN